MRLIIKRMVKCIDCCKSTEKFKAQFPTTLYEGQTCDICDRFISDTDIKEYL